MNTQKTGLLRGGIFTAMLLTGAWMLSGCQGGASTEANPAVTTSGTTLVSVGGVPQTDLVQAFKIEMWPNLYDKCGNCHVQGGQSPDFARTDDVNLAYNAAITVTDMSSPVDSQLVSKVAGGHNCWLATNGECASVMTRWIENWLAGTLSAGRDITLNPVAYSTPAGGKTFPVSPADFQTTVWPLLTANCSSCHVPNPANPAQLPQSPFFAITDVAQIDIAYDAAKPKIDLDDPALSRFYIKLLPQAAGGEGHNCWDPLNTGTPSCADSADAMLSALQAFAGAVPAPSPVNDPNASGGVTLADATLASGGNRYESNLLALYEFEAGSGTFISDVSGVSPDLHLTLSGSEGTDFNWVGGYGIEFVTPSAEARGTTNVDQLQNIISFNGEYSIEAWVIPANVTQENANIVSFSGGDALRNFTLGQNMYNYDFLHFSSTTGLDGQPATSTPDADEVLQSSLQHVVATFDPVNGRRIFVNGQVTNAVDTAPPGTLENWSSIYPLILGNEVGGNRPWKGILKLVALHDRALTHEQIVQNFEVGVGEKYFMLFPIGHINGVPAESYIMFEFSQLDAYGYLLHNPTYVYLGGNNSFVVNNQFTLKGMRIGLNGNLLTDGQAYSNLDVTIGGADFDTTTGMQPLNRIGTVLPVQNGISTDEFYLMFDEIGLVSNPYVEPTFTAPTPTDPAPVPDMGVRVFSEINAALSEMTGVPLTNSEVASVYQTYEQQLPTVENIDGFLGSHQMAIAQLALTYCNELVDGTTGNKETPAEFFPGFDFNQVESVAFDTQTKRNQVIDPLLSAALNWDQSAGDLTSQPDNTDVRNALSATGTDTQTLTFGTQTENYTSLIEQMVNNCNPALTSCNSTARTTAIVKGTCAAAMGAAVMLIQ